MKEKAYPYLYLYATYLKVRRGAGATRMALSACIGVDEEDFREVLASEVGLREGSGLRRLLALRGLIGRAALRGVRLVLRDDHEGIKASVAGELLEGALAAQRGAFRAQRASRNVLSPTGRWELRPRSRRI